jgi:hypothetical protein
LFDAASQPAAQQAPPPKPLLADEVVIEKGGRVLELLHEARSSRASRCPSASTGAGRNTRRATVARRKASTASTAAPSVRNTRALHISYPDAHDRARAQAMNVEPGGGIYIRGVPRDYGPYDPPERFHDWTDGCISVGNAAIVKIWDAVPDGTPIDIRP